MGVRRTGSDEDRPQGVGTRSDREHPEGLPGLTPDPPEGAFERTFALIAALPPKAVIGIFARYGKPLAVPMPPVADDDQRALLPLPDGGEAGVRVLQVRGYGDVIANDYFVLERGGDDALAVAGPLFAGALEAIARAAGVE